MKKSTEPQAKLTKAEFNRLLVHKEYLFNLCELRKTQLLVLKARMEELNIIKSNAEVRINKISEDVDATKKSLDELQNKINNLGI